VFSKLVGGQSFNALNTLFSPFETLNCGDLGGIIVKGFLFERRKIIPKRIIFDEGLNVLRQWGVRRTRAHKVIINVVIRNRAIKQVVNLCVAHVFDIYGISKQKLHVDSSSAPRFVDFLPSTELTFYLGRTFLP